MVKQYCLDNIEETLQYISNNPNNVQSLRQRYDVSMGYDDYHEFCKNKYSGNLVSHWSGYEKVKILEKDYCERLIKIMENKWHQTENTKFRRTVLEAILQKPLDNKITGFFNSHYIPLWMRWYKNDSSDRERPYAFHWHCDGGPRAHLKLLLYLNSSQVCGGNTYLLDKEETKNFENIGYVFCPLQYRVTDLTPLAEHYSIPFNPIDTKPLSGEGILFEPSAVMHKGQWPSVRKRYMIQILFIPSVRPWQEMMSGTELPFKDNAFPSFRK